MDKIYVADIKDGDAFQSFFTLKAASIKTGKTGKPYLDMVLLDATGSITARKWDVTDIDKEYCASANIGRIVKVEAETSMWQGKAQLSVKQMRFATDEDELNRMDFFKSAPEKSTDMYEYIIGKINGFADEDLKKLCLDLFESNKDKLMYYPAAMSNHHAEYGGLLYHVKRMMMMGERACEVYTNLNKDLLLAGVVVHDIEKLTEILSDQNGVSPGYSFEGKMLGHLVSGVKVIHDKCIEFDINEEKEILLEHMVLTHHYEPEYGSPKKPLFPEAELLHYLDMLDAKMFDMEEALSTVEPGEFGERIWTLDNRTPYKSTF